MAGKIQKVSREFNGVSIEQRSTDGFINGTAMCVACGKRIDPWLRTKDTLKLFEALAVDLGLEINCSDLSNLDEATPLGSGDGVLGFGMPR